MRHGENYCTNETAAAARVITFVECFQMRSVQTYLRRGTRPPGVISSMLRGRIAFKSLANINTSEPRKFR